MFKFEELNVYQESKAFVTLVYKVTSVWPKSEIFGLTSQIQRAAVSILLNIAEGSGRTAKDFDHFLSLSRGSCYECIAILEVAKNLKYIDNSSFQNLYLKLETISKMITNLKKSLRTTK